MASSVKGNRKANGSGRNHGTGDAPVLKGAVRLLPYQRRWVDDGSQLKIVVKARQIGYSFAATLRAVLECVRRKTTWIFLSKGERQSRLLMEKVQEHIQSCGIVAQASESAFFEGTLIKQLETRFANGSVIYGLPANPDTARGYTGNVTLDEFAFHADAEKIYAALFPSITRGFGLEVISTPNGEQGKFYELAKAAGLVGKVTGDRLQVSGAERSSDLEIHNSSFCVHHSSGPVSCNLSPATWSAHWCDVYQAIREGLKIDLNLLRAGCDDETAWQQEYCCQFVSSAENFIPPELLAACLSAEATLPLNSSLHDHSLPDLPNSSAASAPGPRSAEENRNSKFEIQNPEEGHRVSNFEFPVSSFGPLAITRMVKTFTNTPFAEQLEFARELLAQRGANGEPLVRRAAIDATGMGAPLAEALATEFGPRVEPVVFTAAIKEDLAYRTRRRMESRLSLLPDAPDVRRAFSAIKRLVTATGALRFDAARSDAGHADAFWAKALADYAAESQPVPRLAEGFLADGVPIISPAAFAELGTDVRILEL